MFLVVVQQHMDSQEEKGYESIFAEARSYLVFLTNKNATDMSGRTRAKDEENDNAAEIMRNRRRG